MKLNDIVKIRGSGGLTARFKKLAPHKYALELVFRDGSNRTFRDETIFYTSVQLRHDWHNNTHKFYKHNFNEVTL